MTALSRLRSDGQEILRRTFGDILQGRFRRMLRFKGFVLLRNNRSNLRAIQKGDTHLLEGGAVMVSFHHRDSNIEELSVLDDFDSEVRSF
jgi:hypothetical protein